MPHLIKRLVTRFSSRTKNVDQGASKTQSSLASKKHVAELENAGEPQSGLENNGPSNVVLPHLPPELLGEIFDRACFLDTSFNFNSQRGDSHSRTGSPVRTTPLVLGGVCVYWRSVVLSTPKLWSRIPIHLGPPRGASMPRKQMYMLKKWVSRAKEHPLTISLRLEDESNRLWGNHIPRELLKFLAETSHRWLSADLVLPEAWYSTFSLLILAVAKRDKPHFPHLRRLKIQPRWSDLHVRQSSRPRLSFFQTENAPLLEDANLASYFLTDIDIPWRQLTTLTIHGITEVHDSLYVLRQTTKLRYLHLSNIFVAKEDPPPRLYHLEYLVIQSSAWLNTQNLLNFAGPMPSLTALEIISPLDQFDFIAIPITLNSLNCQLQRLNLSDFIVIHHEDIIIDALREIDSLENLEINTRPSSQAVSRLFLDLLGVRSEDSDMYYLPRLKHFRFSGRIQHLQDGFDEALFQALQVRRGSAVTQHMVSPLVSFHIRGTPIDHYDHYRIRSPGLEEKLESLVRDGLVLDVVFGWTPWLKRDSARHSYDQHRL